MERNVKFALVGGVVSLLGLLLAVLSLWLTIGFEVQSTTRYTVFFDDAVSGLHKGSTVSYRGVEVGRVIAIRLDPQRPDRIMADIEIDANTPVNTQTEARLQPEGITGLSFIELRTPITAAAADNGLPQGEQYPLIDAAPSRLEQLFTDVPRLSEQLLFITAQLGELLDENNLDAITTTLANIATLSDEFVQTQTELASLQTRLEQTLTGIDTLTETSTRTLTAVNAALPTLHTSLGQVSELSTRLDALAATGQQMLANNAPPIRQFTRHGLAELTLLLRDSRTAVQEFTTLTRQLRENPAQLIYRPHDHGLDLP